VSKNCTPVSRNGIGQGFPMQNLSPLPGMHKRWPNRIVKSIVYSSFILFLPDTGLVYGWLMYCSVSVWCLSVRMIEPHMHKRWPNRIVKSIVYSSFILFLPDTGLVYGWLMYCSVSVWCLSVRMIEPHITPPFEWTSTPE